MDQPVRNIYQRLNEVRKKVDYVRKEKRVGEGGYLAVTHDQITALTRQHLIEHGILILPSLVSSMVSATGTFTAKGIPFIRYEARYRFQVVNMDDPQDKFEVEIESHAMDQGDKAPGKALSYAKKYAVLKLLEIERGEEEEERAFQRSKVTPAAGAEEAVKPERKEYINRLASTVIDCLEMNMPEEACKAISEANLEVEEKIWLWNGFLDSKQRALLKKTAEALKGAK